MDPDDLLNVPSAARREFLRTTLRWTAAGVLVGGLGTGWVRRAGAGCWRPSECAACPVYAGGCDLPKAEAYRRDGVAVEGGGGEDGDPERSEP